MDLFPLVNFPCNLNKLSCVRGANFAEKRNVNSAISIEGAKWELEGRKEEERRKETNFYLPRRARPPRPASRAPTIAHTNKAKPVISPPSLYRAGSKLCPVFLSTHSVAILSVQSIRLPNVQVLGPTFLIRLLPLICSGRWQKLPNTPSVSRAVR